VRTRRWRQSVGGGILMFFCPCRGWLDVVSFKCVWFVVSCSCSLISQGGKQGVYGIPDWVVIII
jgi:hypothetical protein